MSQKSGLAAVLAAITGKQPALDAIPRADHMAAIEQGVTQAFGEGEAQGKLAGRAEGVAAERTRIQAIFSSEEAKGRKHPVVAGNARGETILAWTEGVGWNRGGSVA